MTVTIRPAVAADSEALSLLGRESFIAAFGHLYAPADLEAFLDEYRTVATFNSHLADPPTLVQVAEVDGKMAGYCLIVRGHGFDERPLPHPDKPVYLSQLYCDGAMTGHGLGTRLIEWAIDEARGWGADAVQLSVYSENFGAQRFYQRHGFEKVADIDFWVGDHRDDEFLYELKL